MDQVDERQRAVGANYIARQGKRLVPMAVFMVWLGVGYGDWLPWSLGVESEWARLCGFYSAFVLYWVIGWSYTRRYGSSRGAVPRSVGELVPWGVAVAMMTAALWGQGGGVAVALAALAVTAAGLAVMVWMLFGEFFGRSWPHVIALYTMLMVAAMLQASPSALGGEASVHLALVGTGAGLAIGGPMDSRKLTKDFQRLSGGAR